MNQAAWGLLLGAGISAAADWLAVAAHSRSIRFLTKPAVMVFLILFALAIRPVHGSERGWLVAGLALGLAGDLLLLGEGTSSFLAGLIAFLAGHLAYITGFAQTPWHLAPAVAAAALGLAASVWLVPAYVRSLKQGGKAQLVLPVIAYVGVIVAMLVAAWGTLVPLAMAGALLFVASDAELAWDRFVRPIGRGRLINIVLYQSGQAALAASLVSTTIA